MRSNSVYIEEIRQDFPILAQQMEGKALIYFDNAATSQKPQAVLDAIADYYQQTNANVHRGTHTLSTEATAEFEQARIKVAKYINAPSEKELIWTKGTTDGINLVASSWARTNIQAGDKILVTELEHHSNIVPWQLVCQEKGAQLIVLPITDDGMLALDKLDDLLDEKVKLVSVGHASNALGTVNPVKTIIAKAHAVGAKVMIDGAQAVSHIDVDVQDLDCDFYAFSGHKMMAPTGIGALWGRRELLESMPPYQAGGEMIDQVSFEKTTFNVLPYKFEAGTPNIAGAIGLGAAVDYLSNLDTQRLHAHEQALLKYAIEQTVDIPGFIRYAKPAQNTAILSFGIEGLHSSDIGTLINQQGIAIRDGHHCTQPLMKRLGITGTARASFAFYNTFEEVDALVIALKKIVKMFL